MAQPWPLNLISSKLAIRTEFHPEMNLVAAGRIIAVDTHRRVGQLPKIPRPSRMIQNHFLVKLFEFRAHAKKRTAARRISIMRSISSVVL